MLGSGRQVDLESGAAINLRNNHVIAAGQRDNPPGQAVAGADVVRFRGRQQNVTGAHSNADGTGV